MPEGLSTVGRYLVQIGALIAVIGIVLIVLGRFPGLKLGRLPGDIYIERGNWRFYFPLTTSIIISVVLSFIIWLISRR